MSTLVLPGINQKTEAWAGKFLQELAIPTQDATIQRYLHWQCSDGCLKGAEEVERLKGVQAELLVGKSLGVMLGLLACSKGYLAPSRAVFIGTPVLGFLEENLDLNGLAAQLTCPAIFIQQKDDVVGSAASLREALGGSHTLIEVPGNNHQYKDLKLLARHINKWLAEKS